MTFWVRCSFCRRASIRLAVATAIGLPRYRAASTALPILGHGTAEVKLFHEIFHDAFLFFFGGFLGSSELIHIADRRF
jgi:hypothetical protein